MLYCVRGTWIHLAFRARPKQKPLCPNCVLAEGIFASKSHYYVLRCEWKERERNVRSALCARQVLIVERMFLLVRAPGHFFALSLHNSYLFSTQRRWILRSMRYSSRLLKYLSWVKHLYCYLALTSMSTIMQSSLMNIYMNGKSHWCKFHL